VGGGGHLQLTGSAARLGQSTSVLEKDLLDYKKKVNLGGLGRKKENSSPRLKDVVG